MKGRTHTARQPMRLVFIDLDEESLEKKVADIILDFLSPLTPIHEKKLSKY
jgi:hypothetical protein